jgi:hypothetical protein
MAFVDPIVSAARAGCMSDKELIDILHGITVGQHLSDFQQAVLDEAQMRRILSDSDVLAVYREAPLTVISRAQ